MGHLEVETIEKFRCMMQDMFTKLDKRLNDIEKLLEKLEKKGPQASKEN